VNIYVETNFVLELTFEQEQCSSCEQILQLCEAGKAKLIGLIVDTALSSHNCHPSSQRHNQSLQRNIAMMN
jgi:hypothetical protein